MHATDATVLERWIAQRDPEAFRALCVRYSGMVYSTCRRVLRDPVEAEDVAQECFEALACVKSSPGNYLGPWLHRVATNLAIKRVRSEVRRKKREEAFASEHSPQGSIAWDDVYVHVDEAIAALPDRYRVPLVAHFLDNQTHIAIAEELDLPRQTVSYRISRGVETVRKSLKRKGVVVTASALGVMLGANLTADAAPAALASTLGKLALAGMDAGSGVQPLAGALAAGASKGAAVSAHLYGYILASLGALSVVVAGAVSWPYLSHYLAPQDKGLQPLASASEPAVAHETGTAKGGPSQDASGAPVQAEQWVEATEVGPGRLWGAAFEGSVEHRLREPLTLTVEMMDWDLAGMPPATRRYREIVTGPDGAISRAGLPFGRYIVYGARGEMAGRDWVALDLADPKGEVTLALKPSAAMDGWVRDPEGHPVAGAVVYQFPRFGNWDRNKAMNESYFSAVSRARTGQDGSFHIEHIDLGPSQFVVKAPGYALSVSDPVPVPGGPVEVTVRPGGTARGQVVDAITGQAVEGVRLRVTGLLLQEWFQSITDAHGQFVLRNLRPARYVLRAFDKRYIGSDGEVSFEVKEGEEIAIPPVRVTLGNAIEGRAYDADTGVGIAGARILVVECGRGSDIEPVLTDSAGKYAFPATIMEGLCKLRLEPVPGYHIGEIAREIRIGLRSQTRVKHLDFALSKQYPVSGIVVDVSGKPVADVAVEASGGPEETPQQTKSGPEGRFALDGFMRDSPVFVAAHTEKMASRRVGPLEAEGGQLKDVTLALEPAGSIEGIVLDSRNRPLDGWQVKAVRGDADASESEYGPVRADERGKFSMSNLAGGEYALLVSPPGSPFHGDEELLRVGLAQGQVLRNLILQHDRGLSISGRVGSSSQVEGAAGKDAEEAVVECSGPMTSRTITDDHGNYTLLGLAEGMYSVRVTNKMRDCCTATLKDVAAGSMHVDFILRPRATIKGRVIRRDDGQPMPTYEVGYVPGRVTEIPAKSLGERRYDFMLVQDPEGTFELKNVDAGQDTLVVSAAGFFTAFLTIDDIPQGGNISDVEIALQPGGGVAGTVADEEGKPVPDAMIFVGELPEPAYQQAAVAARSHMDGRFNLLSVPDHPTTLFCLRKGYAPASAGLDTAQSSEVDITLSRGGTLEGVVRLAGEPIPNQDVRIDKGLQPLVSDMYTRTDSSGAYRFENLPPGSFQVQAQLWERGGSSARPLRSLTRNADVASGRSTSADFDFPAGDATIQGTVSLNGTPVTDALFELYRETPDGREEILVTFLPDGSFLADTVPPGPATLVVRAWGQNAQEYKVVRRVHPGPGESLQLDIELSPPSSRP